MASAIFQRQSDLGENLNSFITRINADLLALGNITAMSFTLIGLKNDRFQLTMPYRTGGGSMIQAVAGYSTDASDPESSTNELNAALAALPTYQAIFFRSIPPPDAKRTSPRRMVALCATTIGGDGHPWRKGLKVGFAVNSIGQGGFGPVQIVNAEGAVIDTVNAQNRGGFAWLAGSEGWLLFDEGGASWWGYPSPCVSP